MAIENNREYYANGTVYLANGNNASGKYECRLLYKCIEQNIEGNYSKLYAELQVRSVNRNYSTYGRTQTTKINGEKVNTGTEDMSNTNVWQVFGGKTFTIYHNADGTKNFTVSANFSLSGVSGYSLGNGNASVTFDLPTIPRASKLTISANNVNIGSTITINTNRASNTFKHYLYLYLFATGKTYNIGYADTSINWTIPNSLIAELPNSVSSNARIYCDTWANEIDRGTYIGTSYIDLVINVPSNVTPSISSINISEANAKPKQLGIYVQGKSQLNVSISASGNQGSTIKSYQVTGIDNTTYNQSSFRTNLLSRTGNNTITVKVVDSRGRTATKTAAYNVVPYNNPSISEVSTIRSNSNGSNNDEGTSLKYNFVGSVSTLNNKNTHNYKIGYRVHNTGSYTWITISNNAYTINQKNKVLPNVKFDIIKPYDILFRIEDYFGATERLSNLGTVADLINFNASGKAIAFGKISEAGPNEKLFEVGMPFKYKGKELSELINNKIHVININPIVGNNYAPWGNSYYYIKNNGNTLHIHLGLSNLPSNRRMGIYALPRELCPNHQIQNFGGNGTSDLGMSVIFVGPGGIDVNTSGNYCLADIEYDLI